MSDIVSWYGYNNTHLQYFAIKCVPLFPFIPYDKFDEVQTEVARLRSIYLSAHELTNQIHKECHDSESKKFSNSSFIEFIIVFFMLFAIAWFLSFFFKY